ncbi:MAG: ATP-dependent RecD-like DNA helicase [Holophagales bacterium]|nr:ATP-dependent RecD-like DNA helicase [Holophagales bacterium]
MKPEMTPPERELLAGQVERVTFHSEESGFAVLRVRVRGRHEAVTVVGHAAAISPGEELRASGTWVSDLKHGPQFKAETVTTVTPTSPEGIERFLASGLVKGVGPHFAKRLVEAFGTAVFEVIEAEPGRLREVPGVGPLRAERIVASWAEQRGVREIMVFLHSHGVGTSRAVRIYRAYGADAISVVSKDPYRLARDVRGIGFVTADALARRLGIPEDAMIRVRAGVSHVLAEALDDGHCGLARETLVPQAAELLGRPGEQVREALELELADRHVVADEAGGKACVFLPALHAAERVIAERIAALAAGSPPWRHSDPASAIPWVEARTGVTLSPSQRSAVAAFLRSKVLVLTGGPGVGKTTLVDALLRIVFAESLRIALAAPTGRAARRLSESTRMEAKTLHRLLEVDPSTGRFRRGRDNPLEADLVVVDEASMIDVLLARSLLEAMPPGAALLLVGDADQLPSVGPGQVLRDILESAAVPAVRLTEIFRQAAESRIVVGAHRIRDGHLPDLTNPPGTDLFFFDAKDPEDAARRVVEVVSERIPRRFGLDPTRDVQVLVPVHRGPLGARALNEALGKALNPGGTPRVSRFGQELAPGDRVMQIENDYDKEVYNGDLGVVTAVDPDEGELRATFEGREVPYAFDELDVLQLAWATTIHKSQGSEYPAVVIPLGMTHYAMLERNLLYTAVTRGKKLVVLVGDRRAIAIAAKRSSAGRRLTRLEGLLSSASAPGPR